MPETVELHIDGEDGEDTVTLPTELVEMLREGEESAAEVVGDLAMFGCAQRIHAAVHHSEGDTDDLESVEQLTMDLFEKRFGASYAELTGHQH
ncbi:DUF7545 family protein [Halorarius halobius]|uniref:DUF7545 family protein n=1 Tax=Halorarius halobius TaxID=2962671 RepID=UPI0020CE1180|nr:hypothetical protein [Halorarius halobius]